MLKLEDLKIGMKVKTTDLSEIFDTYIILTDITESNNDYVEGTIVFIGKEPNAESSNLFFSPKTIHTVYNDSFDREEDTSFYV